MNPELIFELLGLVLALARPQGQSADIEQTLAQIVTMAAAAYKDHTGELLDPQRVGLEATL